MIHLWRGFHNSSLVELLATSWEKNELVIMIPMHLKDFSFLSKMSQIKFYGEWPVALKAEAEKFVGDKTHPDLAQAIIGVFTSGTSTGQSRLIFYNKQNIETSLKSIRELFDVKRIKKIFTFPQPLHTFGLLLGYMQAILNKAEVHFYSGAYTSEALSYWLKTVDENTLTLGAPTHFIDLIQFIKSQKLTPPKSYSAIVGGAKVSGELWDQLRTVLQIEQPSVGYGATEASPGVTHLPPGIRPTEDGDIGYPLNGVEVEISEEGLRFQGPNVCYLILENHEFKRPNNILLRDAIVSSRSEAKKGDGKSRYSYLGRVDSMINRGGVKVSLEVIETQLAHFFNAKCVAVSLYNLRLGDELGLIIKSEETLTTSAIQSYLQQQWGFATQDSYILFDEIPYNANGKFDRVEATRRLLKKQTWQFPVNVQHLRAFLPHRGGAIWVDELTEVKARYGKVRVDLKSSQNYFSKNETAWYVRESACIEWVAQSYGYVAALNDILDLFPANPAARTYIADVKPAEFYFSDLERPLTEGDKVDVEVLCTHDFGKLKVIEGKVFHNLKLLSRMSMKLYCD